MRVLELFAGYGSQALALENLGIEFSSDISEIDQYAIKAYNQIHGDTHNWGDITKIDETKLPYYDLITYSSPCQDFSVAGLGKGGDKGSGTRSSLLWECERIIRAVKPKYLLMENVKNLVGKKHIHNFTKWLKTLEMMGYWNFWQVLNAKDYGVPQNRERVFVVSILGGSQYLFPNKIKLEKRLKDILEPQVDKKYYLSDDIASKFLKKDIDENTCTGGGYIPMVTEPKVIQVGNIVETDSFGGNPQRGRIYSADGCSPALNTMQGGGREPKVIEVSQNAKHQQDLIQHQDGICRTIPAGTHGSTPHLLKTLVDEKILLKSKDKRLMSLVEKTEFEKGKVLNLDIYNQTTDENISQCLTEPHHNSQRLFDGLRIRKLTPRECWRLMGVKDEQYNKLHDISNTQLYKMAGNSIVVDVLMGIFKNMFLGNEETKGQLTLF